MKKNLGKIFFIFVLLHTTTYAKELASYELYTNKQNAFVKEPIEVTFTAKQKNHTNVMFFFLKPKTSDDYQIKLFTKEIHDKNHHDSSVVFKYILFPLKEKEINIDFDFTVKTASDKGVAHAFETDHDEGIGVEGDLFHIRIKPLVLKIKKLSHHVDLIGDFRLLEKIDSQEINQYENTNLHYTLYGTGYTNKIDFINNIDAVSLFSDTKELSNELIQDGYKISRDYTYSLSSKKDFTIPAVEIQAYSPKQNRFYTLKTSAYHIKVSKIDTTKLLDKEESPQTKHTIDTQTIKQFFIYMFIFSSGYLVALLTQNTYKNNKKIRFQDIRKSINPKELILILLNNYKNEDIHNFISDLEKVAYGDKERNFKDIKKSILKQFM